MIMQAYKLSICFCIYNLFSISLLFILEAYRYPKILTDPLSILIFIGELVVFFYAPYQASQTIRKWDVLASLVLTLMGVFIFTAMIFFYFQDNPKPFFLFG